MNGAVASGHPLTTKAAIDILNRGGTAFDAAVAAGFASIVTEPFLTSLGGGGFLLAHKADTDTDVIYDFFVNAPGKGLSGSLEPVLFPVEVKFKATRQTFHVGMGSVAVPGMLKGLIQFCRDLCTLEIEDIIAPTLNYLDEGVEATELHHYILGMLHPIIAISDYGKEIFAPGNGRFHNPLLREFLGRKSPDEWLDTFYGAGADAIEEQMRKGNGLVTARDMREYEVVERIPLSCSYRDFRILINPPPSFGGTLLRAALSSLADKSMNGADEGHRLVQLADAMKLMNDMRNGVAGTTHISVIDEAGNAVSVTASNGSNSGMFLGDTGVMLNNMMGEDDLHPHGFHAMEPGHRVGSMMSPAMIKEGETIRAVLGSGGSKRIKTAMLQAIHNVIDREMAIKDAIEEPRIHLDDEDILQVEPGPAEDAIKVLSEHYRLNLWEHKDLYFGGVHSVTSGLEGWGDTRRGGSFGKT
jgi:gamma-glutamyltranspeptidase/glutathione hydrolase